MRVQLQNYNLVGITEIWWDGCMTGVLQWRDTRYQEDEECVNSGNTWSSAWEGMMNQLSL